MNTIGLKMFADSVFALSFGEWVRSLDPARRTTTTSPGSFLGITVMGLAGMAIASFVPGPREFFSLNFSAAALLFVPPMSLGFLMGWLERKEPLGLFTFGWLSLLGVALFQLYMWGLVAFSDGPGASVMAAFPILLTCFHGHLYHSTIKYPFPLLASASAALIGCLLNIESSHLAIMCIAAPMALASHVLLGTYARDDYYKRKDHSALRETIDAMILEERGRTIDQITHSLNELRSRNHDLSNTLSCLNFLVPKLTSIVADEKGYDEQRRIKAAEIGASISHALESLNTMLAENRATARAPQQGIISPHFLLTDEIKQIQQQFPNTKIFYNEETGMRYLEIPFSGGSVAFRRVIHNCLLNACQGNGLKSASNIHISLTFESFNKDLICTINDNGPGFTLSQLASPITLYQTTKKNGTGLGLYSASRILSANSGILIRENRTDNSGALITIKIPVEKS